MAALICGVSARADEAAALLDEINRARTAPRQYANTIEASAGRFRSAAAVKEALVFLRAVRPLPPLKPSRGLIQVARGLVRSQGATGGRGHVGTVERFAAYGEYDGIAAENIWYGSPEPAVVVAGWIVDEGVPGKLHRANLFQPQFRVAGGAVGPHRRHGSMAVMEFATGFSAR